jgi:fumarate hydratase subunit alpha
MRQIDANTIKENVAQLCMDANYCLPTDVSNALKNAQKVEKSLVGKTVFEEISTNQGIALEEKLPLCQDCGTSVFLLEIGQDVHIRGGDLSEAINEGVKQGYDEGFLRKSMVYDPVFTRANTGDNTPAVIHTEIVPGDKIKIVFCPKGGGCENMSALKMMTPADGIEGIKRFVVDFVKDASGNPCPPTIIGVGIGGTFEKVAFLAKKAVLRTPLGTSHPDKRYAQIEKELLDEINNLGIGPMGFGGKITALAVHIETHPVHLAMMPVAINMNCHVARQRTVII